MQDGFTGLILVAGQEDSTDIITALIEANANPNVKDRVYTGSVVIMMFNLIILLQLYIGEW